MILREKIEGLFILTIFIIALTICSNIATTETYKATVIKIKNNIATIEDENGNKWIISGRDLCEGTELKITVYNNHTELDSGDDKIKKIKKIK